MNDNRNTARQRATVINESDERPAVPVPDQVVNFIFQMTETAAAFRWVAVCLALVLIWTLFAFTMHPFSPAELTGKVGAAVANSPLIDSLKAFIGYIIGKYIAVDVLSRFLTVLIPFWLGIKFAGDYLADIFELRDISVARRFVTQAAFAIPGYGIIRIEEGRVRQEDRRSPIYLIGGPGRVIVNLENAALFETFDGRATVVGPTLDRPESSYALEGFERLRQIIDLRDQTMQFDVTSRTKDGIAISLKDVRVMFSIRRDSNHQTLERPYPFRQDAVEQLVYDQGLEPWSEAMTGMVRSELSNFISRYTLSEILSSIGQPEVNRQINNQRIIQNQIHRHRRYSRRYMVYNEQRVPPRPSNNRGFRYRVRRHRNRIRPPRSYNQALIRDIPTPLSIPRTDLSDRFFGRLNEEFAQRFPEQSQNAGVQLHWINVGSWSVPNDLISNDYIDAWRITSENQVRLSPRYLADLQNNSRVRELARLIEQIPLQAALMLRREGRSREAVIEALIQDYSGKIRLAREEAIREHRQPSRRVQAAYETIQRVQRQAAEARQRYHYAEPDMPEPPPE